MFSWANAMQSYPHSQCPIETASHSIQSAALSRRKTLRLYNVLLLSYSIQEVRCCYSLILILRSMYWKLGGGKTFGVGWTLWMALWSFGAWPIRRFWDSEIFLIFYGFLAMRWEVLLCHTLVSHHNVLPHHRPNAMGPIHHGMKPSKLWVKINIFWL
jgi:hypothetical protein